jgi:exodeoxyribonuclease III
MVFRIATWNINSVRARIDQVERFLTAHAPDVLCLQESKCEDQMFPRRAFEALGYPYIHLNGQKANHGVATISRVPLAPYSRYDWQDNGEARHLGIRLPSGVVLENVYIPAGGEVPDRVENPKFGQKLDFLARMARWGEGLREQTILVGDFNVAPLPDDVWNHKLLVNTVSHTQVEIDALSRLRASHNWVDLGRKFDPAPARPFTWWSYRAKDWATSNKGRRLDHIWCSPTLAPAARGIDIIKETRGWERPSDHVPVIASFEF